MKTRVVRYWGNTEWLFRVERLCTVNVTDQFAEMPGVGMVGVYPTPVIGSEIWRFVAGPTSEANALRIAREVAKLDKVDQEDVVAEFGVEPAPTPIRYTAARWEV